MSSEASLRHKLKKKAKLAVSTSRNSRRTRKDENSLEGENGNVGSMGKLKRRMKFKGVEKGEEESGREFGERGKMRALDSSGRRKRIYAEDKEGMVEGASKKKALLKRGEKKKVKDEVVVEGKNSTSQRTMWVHSKSRDAAGSEAKHSSRKMKGKKGNVVLATAKLKAKAKEDDYGSGLVKKNREKKSELSKEKSQKVVSPSSSAKKKARDKAGLDDDDVEILDDQPKKKKRVIKIDPHDISNKRLDDGIGIDGRQLFFLSLHIHGCFLAILLCLLLC